MGEIAMWRQGLPCLEPGTQLPGGVFGSKLTPATTRRGFHLRSQASLGQWVGVEGWRTAVGAPRLLLNPSQQGRPCLLSVWSQTAGPGAARRRCFCPHHPRHGTSHTGQCIYQTLCPQRSTRDEGLWSERGAQKGEGMCSPSRQRLISSDSHSPIWAYFP